MAKDLWFWKELVAEEFLGFPRARSGLFPGKSWKAWNSCAERDDSKISKPLSGANLKMVKGSDMYPFFSLGKWLLCQGQDCTMPI